MATATASQQDIQKRFVQAGFVVSEAGPGRLDVQKFGCAAYLDRVHDEWIYSGPPYFIVCGVRCELEDRGYQKFWLSKSDGQRFPIRRVELETLHRFDEEVRYLMGVTTLYNESLGSTNARTVYDRLTGRPDR